MSELRVRTVLVLAALLVPAGSTAQAAPAAWPGSGSVATADAAGVVGEDLSGLHLDGGVLWAAQNTGRLWRLLPTDAGGWAPDTAAGWTSGKALRYPNGTGAPDSEGVTEAAGAVFVAAERDGKGSSRTSVLRYDVSGSGAALTASREWNLTADLPPVGANLGFEGLTWVPDAALTGAGFLDASTGLAYDPARYGAHGGGVFFVAVEGTGVVHGYVLRDNGAFQRIASVSTGLEAVVEVQWEPRAKRLWAVCDNTCDGEHRTFAITAGKFAGTASHRRPSGMPNLNNEGFALAGECSGGAKPVYWSDDGNTGGHALRRGSIGC